MSWNNITPIWTLCNPYKIPYQDGYYWISPLFRDRQGPVTDYDRACNNLISEGGTVTGKLEWLE